MRSAAALGAFLVLVPAARAEEGDGVLFYGEKGAKASSLTAEKAPKDVQPHDLVTVRIKDVHSFLNNTKLLANNKYDTSFEINKFFNLTTGAGGSTTVARPTAGDKPAIDISSERKLDNVGSVNNRQVVEAVITGRVVEVYPNRTFSFEATQVTELDETKTTMTLFGVARVQDLSPDNVVMGERLDGKQFSIKTEGPASRMSKRGWFVKLLDAVWPF